MTWRFPIVGWHLDKLPTKDEPGSFGCYRKHDVHCGIDLYTVYNAPIIPCEPGRIINIENYTGSSAGSPWWLPTKSILVEGESGVICYGEVNPFGVKIGDYIDNDIFAHVARVLINPPKSYIANHSLYMLHFELYKHGTTESVWWFLGKEKPSNLLDPTEKLQKALDKLTCKSLI